MTIQSMEEQSPFEKLTLLEVGPEGSGKSWLAATGRKPVLFLDYDQRAGSVAGKPGVFAETDLMRDPGYPNQPTAFQNTLNILGQIENKSLLLRGELPKTLVIDSIYNLGKVSRAYALYTQPDLRRTIKLPDFQVHVPLRDGWTSEMSMVEAVIGRALAIPDLDLICTMHETVEEAPESTDEKPSFTGKIIVHPVRYKILLKYFNEVWRLERSGKVPTVQILPNWQFTTKSNLGFDVMDEPNIEKAISRVTSAPRLLR